MEWWFKKSLGVRFELAKAEQKSCSLLMMTEVCLSTKSPVLRHPTYAQATISQIHRSKKPVYVFPKMWNTVKMLTADLQFKISTVNNTIFLFNIKTTKLAYD